MLKAWWRERRSLGLEVALCPGPPGLSQHTPAPVPSAACPGKPTANADFPMQSEAGKSLSWLAALEGLTSGFDSLNGAVKSMLGEVDARYQRDQALSTAAALEEELGAMRMRADAADTLAAELAAQVDADRVQHAEEVRRLSNRVRGADAARGRAARAELQLEQLTAAHDKAVDALMTDIETLQAELAERQDDLDDLDSANQVLEEQLRTMFGKTSSQKGKGAGHHGHDRRRRQAWEEYDTGTGALPSPNPGGKSHSVPSAKRQPRPGTAPRRRKRVSGKEPAYSSSLATRDAALSAALSSHW